MSDTQIGQELLASLQEEVGDALRSVLYYNADEYEMVFLRDDVDAIYSTDEIEDIIDDLRLRWWGSGQLQDIFNAGDLQCGAFGFEDALMFHFSREDFQGVFVTIDRGAPVGVEQFLETCREHL